MQEPEALPILDVEGGITVQNRVRLSTDFASMRTLIESGVSCADTAKAFKVDVSLVKRQARKEGWLTPAAVGKMRRELAQKSAEVYRKTGKAADVSTIKAQIWEDRGEKLRERTFEIVSAALNGVSDEFASKMIRNPKGLLEVVTATRLVTGETAAEATNGPQIAVNVGFLRSSQPVPVTTDVVDV